MKKIGLYLHIPFCKRKCPYCDFFSSDDPMKGCTQQGFDSYTALLCGRIKKYAYLLKREADTVYFGGGTPSLIGDDRLCRILETAKKCFGIRDAEITLEVNPEKRDIDFEKLRYAGFNRISIGLQSADNRELKALGRLHNAEDAENCIASAKRAGFENISLDLMLAVPEQTEESMYRSIDFCADSGARHISAYLLKIEQGTPFYRNKEKLPLFDDDTQAEFYLSAVRRLKERGFIQYEISNFAKTGYEGRHNLKYWHDEEYLGLGPSAHSFIGGRRFYFERSFEAFRSDVTVDDGEGGDPEEYIMLALRLREGVDYKKYRERFGSEFPREYRANAEKFSGTGLIVLDDRGFRFTPEGFAVSNSLISEILG